MTHDSNLTISSRPAFFSVLAALNASVVSLYGIWFSANATTTARAEEHGFDPSRLLPHATPFWFAAHASLLSLLALDVLVFLAWRRSRSQPESPR